MKETKKCNESRQLNIGHPPIDRVELEGYVGALSISMTSENQQNDQSKCQYKLLEKIISKDNLNEAYKRVKKNKGSYGIDKMGVDELLTYLKENGNQLKQSIQEGSYKPSAVRRVEIPKSDGKKRPLGIPTVVDRVVQQAIAQVLSPYLRKYFQIIVTDLDQTEVPTKQFSSVRHTWIRVTDGQ